MRQKNVTSAGVLVIVIVIASVAVFAVVRQGRHMQEGHQAYAETLHHYDNLEGTAEEGHHENSSGHHNSPGNIKPSGTLKEGERIIKMKARQFEFEPERIIVRKGETVRLELTSEDVTHGINIEYYDINRTLNPGKTEVITFTADKAGRFRFHCSVYCGKDHSDMRGELIVTEQD